MISTKEAGYKCNSNNYLTSTISDWFLFKLGVFRATTRNNAMVVGTSLDLVIKKTKKKNGGTKPKKYKKSNDKQIMA